MLYQRWQHALCMAALTLIASAVTACGGGNGSPDPDPSPIKSTMSGKLQQDASAGITTPAGSSIANASISLLNGATVVDTAVTDNSGNFSFSELDAGSYTLQIEVEGDVDLNVDGDNDVVIINMPVSILANSIVVFNTSISGVDIDLDGELDSIDVQSLLTDNKGRSIRKLMRLLHRLGKLLIDEDNDGDFDDDDLIDDFDSDGVPDNAQGSLNSLHGGVLRGSIEAVDSDSITVRGISFSINSRTQFKLRGNKQADIDDFDVGDNVHIHARWTGEAWVALMIKSSGPGNGGGGGDDPDSAVFHGTIDALTDSSLTIEGREFELNSQTDWIIFGNSGADGTDFSVGDFVVIFAIESGSEWLAEKVVLIKAGDGENPLIQNFSGAISLLSATSLTVNGQAITLNGQTQWKLENGSVSSPSAFGVGDLVVVRAQQQGTAWIALSVTMDEDLPLTDSFSGLITLLSATSLTVDGQAISINSQTEWENEDGSAADPLLFHIGDEVRVDAEMAGSAWVATTIVLLSDNGPLSENFIGLIEAIDSGSLTLHGDLLFTVNAGTDYLNADGSVADSALFDAGDFVSVEATAQGSGWVAVAIRLLDDEPVIDSFSGTIEAISGTQLMLQGGVVYSIDAQTHFMLPDGSDANLDLFDLGDFVTVEARQDGSAWIAMHVTLTDDEPVFDSFTAPIISRTAQLLSISGTQFVIDEISHFMNEDGSTADPADFDTGDLVMVEARLEAGVWYALHITFIDDNDTAPVVQVFDGSITTISEFSLTVDSDLFSLNSETDWFLADGNSGTFMDFSSSDDVQVIARQDGLVWTALKVSMQ